MLITNTDRTDASVQEEDFYRTDPVVTEDRVVLFSLNGTDYYVPKKVGPNIALRYLRDVRRHGKEHAIGGLMEAMLGERGMDALAEYEDLTTEDLESVMVAVEKHVLGPLEKSMGKGQKGPGR